MVGFGAIGELPVGGANLVADPSTNEAPWHQPWSMPRRYRKGHFSLYIQPANFFFRYGIDVRSSLTEAGDTTSFSMRDDEYLYGAVVSISEASVVSIQANVSITELRM